MGICFGKSAAFYRREMHEHKSFLDFVERLRANPAGFRVSAAQSKNLKRFLKDEYLNKRTNEIVDGRKFVAMIDDEKLNAVRVNIGSNRTFRKMKWQSREEAKSGQTAKMVKYEAISRFRISNGDWRILKARNSNTAE